MANEDGAAQLRHTPDGYECPDCGAGSVVDCSHPADSPEGRRCFEAWDAAADSELAAVDTAAAWPSLAAAWDEPAPEAVLSVAGGGTLAGVGEPCILSGPGGAGKSSLALCLALAAGEGDGPDGDAGGGLLVRRGRVAVASYEDAIPRLAGRARWLAGDPEAWAHVRAWRSPGPLWLASDGGRTSGPGPAWDEWRRGIEGASLAVLDPASVAYGANPNDGAAVRAFLHAAAEDAGEAGAGLLILAHDTKAARFATGDGPGAGAVSGSGQWHDGARAVLHLGPAMRPDVAAVAVPGGIEGEECRILRTAKANYSRTGGGWLVRPQWEGGNWRGLRIGEALPAGRIRDVDAAAARKPKARKGQNGGTTGARPEGGEVPGV